ncbi:HAMP domain-containing histidine kinase [Planctomycetales bacterium ZRK34]|nr:HAMP domain-containing histidine kinase [Planctomycetales bacterium ZRK34]
MVHRIALLHAVLIVGTVLLVGWWITHRFSEALVQEKWEQLSLASRNVTQQLNIETERLCGTVEMLARSSEVHALLKASRTGDDGAPSHDDSSQLLSRLEQTFRALVDLSPSLNAVRLLDVNTGGMELIHVERRNGWASVAKVSDTSDELHRDLYQQVLAKPSSQAYLSNCHLERVHDDSSIPLMDVLHAAAPVYDETGNVAFVLSVSMDCQALYKRIDASTPVEQTLYLADQTGRLLLHQSDANSPAAEITAVTRHAAGAGGVSLRRWISTPQGDRALALRWIDARNRRYGVVLTASYDSIVQAADTTRQQAMIFIGVALAVSLLIAHFYGSRLMKPFREIAVAVESFGRGDLQVKLPTNAPHEVGVLARAFDDMITQVRQRNQALRQANQTLAQKNRELEQFVYTASHDLKSPLLAFDGYLRYIENDLIAGCHEQVHEHVDVLKQASQRMRRTLDDLLELSRAGRAIKIPTSVDLGQTIEHLRQIYQSRLDECGVTLRVRPGLPTVMADQTRLAQMLDNLLVNAIKYGCRDGGVIEIGCDVDEAECRIYVRDDGPGIDARHHEQIFELFRRVDNGCDGTGLGLAIVRSIAIAHGGRVWVESELGLGATFYLTLPRQMRPMAQAA